MPSRNIVKTYVKGGFYHIYNRGVEKRNIFEDQQDYRVFLNYLKEYLSDPKDTPDKVFTITLQGSTFKGVARKPKNYLELINLHCYCLMPNHFHLLVSQNDDHAIERFMKSLLTRYSMYFNKKYNRVGPLFQGIYKAALITEDNHLLHLSRYIHQNPAETDNLLEAYSSYGEYLHLRNTQWVKSAVILKFFETKVSTDFKKFNNYKKFVEGYEKDSSDLLGKLTLE